MIDSPHPPAVVLENLRNRGREWRPSAVPDELKKLKVGNLLLETDGAQFEMRWAAPNPFYNPLCFGTVQPYGEGSRIRAGFKISRSDLLALGIFAAMAALSLIGRPTSVFYRVLFVLAIGMPTLIWARNRNSEPMRANLIKVLSDAATAPKPRTDPFSAVMGTNGP